MIPTVNGAQTFGPSARSDVLKKMNPTNANIPVPTNPLATDPSKQPLSFQGNGVEKTPPKVPTVPQALRKENALAKEGHGREFTPADAPSAIPASVNVNLAPANMQSYVPGLKPTQVVPQSNAVPHERVQQAAQPKIQEATQVVIPKKTAQRFNEKPQGAVHANEEPVTFSVKVQKQKDAKIPGPGQRNNPDICIMPPPPEKSPVCEERRVRVGPVNRKELSNSDSRNGDMFFRFFAVCFTVCLVAACIFAFAPHAFV